MQTLRSAWTTNVLHTTSFIFRVKQKLLTAHALPALGLVLWLIAAELWLAITSLPLYLVAKPMGKPGEQVQQYTVRRVITLSVLTVILVIWALKLLIIGLFTLAYDPRQAFQVRETESQAQELALVSFQIPKAATDAAIPAPTITRVHGTQGEVAISGTATPNQTVVATLVRLDQSAVSPLLYAETAGASGEFRISEDSGVFYLPEGKYSASVVAFDQDRQLKSAPSNGVEFRVIQHPARRFLGFADSLLDILTMLFILSGLAVLLVTV